ncbi:hypothetical protein CBS147333_5560 [Penicillium roqueforti]|nr:hypothetical protein CBS147332_2323 [Penicillium roqueforti]KAI3109575.1 hypothetical protein CBS147333_5560 [Penicillium roqueforti]KAI3109840.1 hypothetical protein CBS147331_5269 [Penicillium roqueforti]KAI3121567.1 hypothetical protein CBS147326_9267 [Penicillium roqueforti]KAI3140931.1 hypothetical protein CBS147325_6222 [Penicillium roqueforti]
MSDRTHPTSFQARPPSPSSPAGSLKENIRFPISSDHIPQTPISPPLMSVSEPSHAANFISSPNQATVHSPNISSPPSSAPMSTQVSQQPTMSTTNAFPTPASSVSGHPTANSDDVDQGRKSFNMGMQDSAENSGASPAQQSTQHRPTDHDRQSFQTDSTDFATGQGQHSTDSDAMDMNKGSTRADTLSLDLDSLQKELTSAFHLCKRSPIVTGPDPTVDLVSLYGLGPIAHSVARMDPVTGEKINRLRKSYEGKLKGLGLSGRNKPVKKEIGTPGSLRYMTLWPEEEWQNQKVHGKAIKVSDMDSALQNLQSRAMQMEPGPIPNNDFWEDILGHEKAAKNPAPGELGKKAPPAPAGRFSSQSYVPSPQPQEADRPRPSRGRKRHYDDNSFAGYGEGFVDDDDDPGFYSNGEGTGKKKRKKGHVAKVSTPMSERSASYGVGMFGIGAR